MIDERTEAREILSLMIGDEPPISTSSAAVVGKARRRQVLTRSATIGGVTLGVVAAVSVAMLARPGPQEIGAALPAPNPTADPGSGTVAPPPKPGVTGCVVGEPGCDSPDFTEDDRSRRLTSALLDSPTRLVPDASIVLGRKLNWPELRDSPWRLVKPTASPDTDWPYVGSAEVGDHQNGFGSVFIHVSDRGTDGRCATLDRTREERVVSPEALKIVEFVDCRDVTLPDGSLVAVSTYRGRNAGGYTNQEGYRKTVVDAVKKDGTRVRVVEDNSATQQATTGAGVTRPDVPLSDEYLFRIVQVAALKY